MGDRNVQSNTDNLNKQELQENKSKDLGNKFEVVSTNGGIPYSVGTDERFLKGEDPLDIRDSREETKQDVPITGKQTLGTESILKKPIGNKVFAQVSFPEQLRHTGLEGLDRKLAIQFSKDMAIGFKNEMESEYFDGTDVAAVDECIMQLKQIESYETDVADALDKIQSKRKEFARKIFDYATLKNKDISVQIPDELSQLGITDEDVDKCWDRCPGPPDLESNACISITDHLFTESRGILQGIADKVSEDGSYICLQGGWYSTTGGHNAYVIIERIGSQLYAYEINSGGGMPDKGSREETSIYSDRRIPGRTIKISDKNLMPFIATIFGLNSGLGQIYNEKRQREYVHHWLKGLWIDKNNENGKPSTQDTGNRPRFFERFQRSGNCSLKSVDILSRSVIQREIATKMGKDINSMEVIKKANLLYRSFAIYTRVRLLEDFLILHKDPSFIPTRDSLDLMRRGLGRIGRYIKRYEHNIKQNNGGRQVAEKLLSKCKSVVDEANKYLNSPDAIEVMRRASVHPSLSVKYPAIQPDGAKNIAKIFANPPGPIPNAIPVPEPSHAPRIDELSLCKKIVKLSTWTAENLQRNFSFMTTQTRSLEIMSSVTELFRLIPLPGGNEWESFVSELSQQEKISFVQNISEIMGFFRTDQTMASIMKNSEVNSIKSQLIDTDLWIPRHVIAPIANVIAKSRIIAFELLMMAADGIGENSDIREICVDNTWFVYFCGSGMNYLLQSEDMEEQKKLMEFILRNENKKRAFNSTGNYVGDTPCPHTIIDIETVSPTVEFCDALAKVSDESYIKQLTNSVTGLIAYNAHVDKDNILSRINLHKGLLLFDNLQISDCSPQEGIFSYVFSSAQLEAQNEQQKTGISSEKFIKFWLIYKCLGIVSDKNETKIILDNDCRETVSVRLPMNALEQFGGGYAGLSENQSYFESTRKQRLDGNSVEDRRTIDAIGIELSNPPTQTLGLLKLLETNDDIGNNFCPSKISIVPNDDTGNNFCPSKISIVPNLLFSALSRPVTTKADHGVDITGLNEDEKKIFEKCVDRVKEYIFTDIRDTAARSWAASDAYSVDTMEFPLLNDAKNRPNVLLDATDKLYAKVKADASENVLGSSRINRLCSVIHAMYIIDKAIIDNANDAVLSAIESRSKRILDDIKKMHEYGDGKNSPISEANTLLRFAENECIATLIAVKQKKNANNSLVGDGVDVQLVVKLYENSAILRSSHICEKMPQGCYDVIYNLTPSLTKYWKVTRTDYIGDVAKQICYALSPGSESLLEDTECTYSDGIVFLKNQSGHQVACVDLVGATANINGNYIEQCSECPYVPDFPRLFKPSREVFRVFTKIGNTWNFDDAKYGKVSIVCSPVSIPTSIPALIPASINPPLNQIYRSFENETDQQWVYIPISNTAVYLQMHGQTNYDRLCLPRCFSSEDFTVWGSPDGKLRICSFSDPSKILYETDEKGNLCDVERRKKGITPNNILFFPNQENVNSFFPNQANFNPFFPNQENVNPFFTNQANFNPFFTNQANFNPFFTNQANDDLSTSFEGHGNVLFYHDGNGEVSEVVFPRYVERDGTTLSLIKKGDHFVLKSDQKYKLVDGPSLKIKPLTDNDPVQQSLLFGYQNAMCFENTDPENAGVFKYLLPDMKIDRVAGLTHEIHSILYENSQKKEILGQARCGEVTVYSNDLDFVEPSICPTNMLGALRLAHIFQTQGEYASALNVLNNIPAKATLSDDEIEGFKRILYWFDPNIGHEQNGLAALVILKATSQILQISPFNEKIKGILSEDGEGSGNRESPFFEVLQKYFSDFDLYSQTMQMDPAEEMALLVNVEILFKSKDKSKGNTLVSRMISNRINHLTKLIEQGAIEFVNTKQIESPNPFYDVERATNADIRAFCKENDQLVMSAGKLRALNDSTIVSQHVGSVYTWRNEKVRDLLNKIDTKILEPNVFSYKKKLDTESSNVASESKKQMPLTDKENKQFGDAFRKFRSEIDEEIDKGAALFELEEENNGIPAPNIEDARKLLSEVNAVKNTTTKSVKLALENLEQTLEKGRIEWSRGSDAWDKWQLPDVLRLYGIYVSNGENGLKLALEHLLTNYPWVEAESIDSILENVETYLVGTNSIRNCKNISEGLEKLCKQDTSEDVRNANWRSIVPLFRGDHSNTLASSEISREIKGNVLLFTYMSGLFPRHDQIQKIKFIAEKITSSPEKCGVLIQQVMGSGKTKVLLPFLISMLMNRRNNLPMIVSHISQMPSVVSELHSILSRIGIKLVQISTDYDSKSLNSQTLRTLRNNLESSKKNRNPVYVISSSTLLAIRTAFRSRWDNEVPRNSNDNGEFASVVCEFTKLFKFLRENVTALMDEVHITLNPKEAFIVQPPCSDAAKAKIPQHEVNFITKFIYGLPENLINAMKENTQDQISSEVLTDTLERHVAEKCGDLLLIPEKIRSEFAKFVCGRFDESDTTSTDEQSGQKSTMSDELKNYIGTLNGNTKSLVSLLHKLISSVIVQCFSKAYGEQYGYNKEGEIVVFRNHLPTESFFQDPYVTLVTYLTATLFKGVPDVLLSEWVKLQADSAKSLVANGIQIDKTEASKRFEKFFGNSGKKLSDVIGNINAEIPEMKQFLSKNLENGMKVALEFANKYSSYVDRSHATTPIDIADIFHNTIEMSGTISNSMSYVKEARTAIDVQDGALGKIVHKLKLNAKDGNTKIVEVSGSGGEISARTVGGMLEQWKKVNVDKIKDLRIIVDYGANFKDQPTQQSVAHIAKFIQNNGIDAEYIEYFDEKSSGFVIAKVCDIIENPDGFTAKKIDNPSVDRPSDRSSVFTFLDSPRSTGTDPYIKANAHGIITCDLFKGNFDGALQAILRLRNFTNSPGQTADLVIRKESMDSMKMENPLSDEETKLEYLLNRMIFNTTVQNTRQHIQSVMLQIQEFARECIERILMKKVEKYIKTGNGNGINNLFWESEKIIVCEENFSSDAWANTRTWCNVSKVAKAQASVMIQKLKEIFGKIKGAASNGKLDDNGELDEELNNLTKKIDSSIQEIQDSIEMLGFADGSGILTNDAEILVEQQKQKEQTAEQHEHELDNIKDALDGDENRYAGISSTIPVPADEISAFDFLETIEIEAIGERVRSDNTLAGSVPLKGHTRYMEAKKAFPKEFDENFFATKNFFKSTTSEDSVFSRRQKEVKYLLISWNDEAEPKMKCLFISMREAHQIREIIESGKLKNCHLCSIGGTRITNDSNVSKLTDKLKEFTEQSMWMGKFFNADIYGLEAKYDLTRKMLEKFGATVPPASSQYEGHVNLKNTSPWIGQEIAGNVAAPINPISPADVGALANLENVVTPSTPTTAGNGTERGNSNSPSVESNNANAIESQVVDGQRIAEGTISDDDDRASRLRSIVNFMILRSFDPTKTEIACMSSTSFASYAT